VSGSFGRTDSGREAERPLREPERGWRSFRVGLGLIALGGLILRLTYLIAARSTAVVGDGTHYDDGSRLLSDGRGFINPLVLLWTGTEVQDAKHPPGWTLVLWVANGVGLRSTFSHQLVAVAVGVATVVMVGLAGRAAFGTRVGLIAAAVVAVYPNIWLYERELVSEPLALLGVATIIWLTYRFLARPRLALAISLGAVTALAALSRSELILVAVLIVAPVILGRGSVPWGRRIGWLGAAAAACIAVVTPWFLYNTTRLEEPVPLSAGLGGAMQAGNCPQTYEGDALGYYVWGCVLLTPTSAESSVADAQYRSIAIHFMRDNASRLPVVVAARVGRTFNIYRPAQQVAFEAERGSSHGVIIGGMVGFWILAPLAIAGAVLARRRGVPIYPLLAFGAIVLVSVALTIGSVRYRAPFEIPMVLLAAVAIDALVGRLRRRRTDVADRQAGAGVGTPGSSNPGSSNPGTSNPGTSAAGSDDRTPVGADVAGEVAPLAVPSSSSG
jgi:4-amino-4-deoxy-L-arabinose transferase-like glycosyltransferase